jgi:spermidine synthase
MAHLPLALLGRPAARALIICFGMGTTFRSVRSWGIPATAVELVPGVPRLFSYFFPDGPALLASKDVHLVIDDGRRFLETTRETYDLITLDPPPPVEAASTSLLYSKEFYSLVRRRLAPGGILQQWFQGGELVVFAAFARALTESFPYVVAYRSFGGFGVHFFGSDAPIAILAPEELASRLPPAAAADFLEWGPRKTVADQFTALLAHPVPLQKLLEAMPEVSALEDDWPVNEYYFLRRLGRAPETF